MSFIATHIITRKNKKSGEEKRVLSGYKGIRPVACKTANCKNERARASSHCIDCADHYRKTGEQRIVERNASFVESAGKIFTSDHAKQKALKLKPLCAWCREEKVDFRGQTCKICTDIANKKRENENKK